MTRKQQIKLAAIDAYGTTNCRAAEHFVAGAVWADAHTNWISVEDALPKIEEANFEWVGSEDVLALLWNGDISVGRYERDNISGEYYWTLYNVDKDHQVTHWQHLPQPPKKGD